MTVEEIFSKLASHMIKGLMIHDQMASSYGFLNLPGYQKCHKYHFYQETCNYRHLNDFYLKYYHKLLKVEEVADPATIPATWYKYSSMDVDTNTKRTAVKDLVKKWVDWEKETVELLQKSCKELSDLGEIFAAKKVKKMLAETMEELCHAECKMMNLEALSYEIGSIIGEQDCLCEKYQKKINCIYTYRNDTPY